MGDNNNSGSNSSEYGGCLFLIGVILVGWIAGIGPFKGLSSCSSDKSEKIETSTPVEYKKNNNSGSLLGGLKNANKKSSSERESNVTNNSSDYTSNTKSSAPKKWRESLPNGGYADFIQYEDGSLKSTRVEPCMFCGGTGICRGCNGAGGRYGRAYGGTYYPCKMCLQTGQCSSCKGEKKITTITVRDAYGNTTLTSSSGYSAAGGSGGTIVNSPRGSSSYSGSSSDSYESSSSSYDKSNDYVETIEYAPNYSGESNDQFCAKCGSVGPAHVHIKRRY